MWLLPMLTLNGVFRTQGGPFPPNMVHGEDYNMFHEFLRTLKFMTYITWR